MSPNIRYPSQRDASANSYPAPPTTARFLIVMIVVALLGALCSSAAWSHDVDLGNGLVERAIDAGSRPAPPNAVGIPITSSADAERPTSAPAAPPIVKLNLGALARAKQGRQNDRDFDPSRLEHEGYVVVPAVIDHSNGRRYFADPEELAEGRLALHPYLIAHAQAGTITSVYRIKKMNVDEVRDRLRRGMFRAGSEVVRFLRPAGAERAAPELIRLVLESFIARR